MAFQVHDVSRQLSRDRKRAGNLAWKGGLQNVSRDSGDACSRMTSITSGRADEACTGKSLFRLEPHRS
jgi:hypothetical protein